jgi:DNA-binding LacI/PurR family transcriptional regulator
MTGITEKPRYVQLADDLRERIRSGELKVGDRLPSYAEMYRRYGATTATVQRVCDLLEQEQLIERRFGSGVYVAEPRKNCTGNIGFIGTASYKAPSVPFHQHLVGAMQQAVGTNQQHLLYLGTADSWDVNACDKVDGVLLCNVENPEPILRALPEYLPRVSVLTIVDGVTSVGVDDYRAAQLAVRHLIDLGHRRIACLMEKLPSEGRRRYAGYRDALLEVGIEADPRWARLTDSVYGGKTQWTTAQPYREWARRQMSAWLSEDWSETNCTAILVQNEVAAMGVMQILQKAGIRVPEEVSVIGFDGTELCDLVTPRLCAVALPLAQIGAKAIEVLNWQIAGEPSSAQAVMLPLGLRPGESVAAAIESPAEASGKTKVLIECG